MRARRAPDPCTQTGPCRSRVSAKPLSPLRSRHPCSSTAGRRSEADLQSPGHASTEGPAAAAVAHPRLSRSTIPREGSSPHVHTATPCDRRMTQPEAKCAGGRTASLRIGRTTVTGGAESSSLAAHFARSCSTAFASGRTSSSSASCSTSSGFGHDERTARTGRACGSGRRSRARRFRRRVVRWHTRRGGRSVHADSRVGASPCERRAPRGDHLIVAGEWRPSRKSAVPVVARRRGGRAPTRALRRSAGFTTGGARSPPNGLGPRRVLVWRWLAGGCRAAGLADARLARSMLAAREPSSMSARTAQRAAQREVPVAIATGPSRKLSRRRGLTSSEQSQRSARTARLASQRDAR